MRPISVFALVPLAAGCLGSRSHGRGEVMQDFALDDVNPNSRTYQRLVDVVEYRGVATAWYFTHST